MAVSPHYRAFVEDQLGRVVKLRSRAMFGGIGLYADDVFFGLVDDDILYFKVDDETRPRYEARGMTPFQPPGEISLSYYRLPGDVLEDMDELRGWAEESVEAARRAKSGRKLRTAKPAAKVAKAKPAAKKSKAKKSKATRKSKTKKKAAKTKKKSGKRKKRR